MIEFIAILVLIFSFFGILVFLISKVPILLKFPKKGKIDFNFEIFQRLNQKLRSYFSERFLEKSLLRFKILALKTENKIGFWLERLRQKNQLKKEEDHYWEELKKAKKSRPG